MSARSILVALADPDESYLLRMAFIKARLGVPVTFVGSTPETLAYMEGDGVYANRRLFPLPGLLLLDLGMESWKKVHILEWLQKNSPVKDMAVVALVQPGDPKSVQRARAFGVEAHLIKPLNLRDLRVATQRLRDYWTEINQSRTGPVNLHGLQIFRLGPSLTGRTWPDARRQE